MTVTAFSALACPLDGQPLQRSAGSWRCAAGHSYDIASQGYTHLLPVQHKRSRDPGDSKEMVAARRRFLQAGHYESIATAVNHAFFNKIDAKAALNLLDAGCGEGYYLRQLAAATGAAQTVAGLGLDISKWAVQSAAKQAPQLNWVVGSNARLPVLPNTLDGVLCLFGFPVYGEFARVLKGGGRLIQVDAGPEHLRQLREIIYPALKAERCGPLAPPPGFDLAHSETISYELPIAGQSEIADLLAMTPHLYKATAEGKARAAALTAITLTVDVRLQTFLRTGTAL
ncbi:MAG: methyltransferase domain-containing protein [Dechloromonas sp.]|nr:methyltransferase domain-containing protein [Dechloromonas sp.]